MNNMKTIAKISLAILALYIVLQIAKFILSIGYFIGHAWELPITVLVITLLGMAGLIVLAIVVGHQLLIKGDKWASRIVSYGETNQPQISTHWLPTTYRLVFILAGILFTYWTLPSFFALVSSFLLNALPSYGHYLNMSPKAYFWARFVSFMIKLALTVYFLYGAPHFVRWQVKKTLEYCKKEPTEVEVDRRGQQPL